MNIDPYAPEFTVDKMHAGHWQLSAAIRLHFKGENPVLVLTLAGAAGEIFSDLVKHHVPTKSWDQRARDVHGLSEKAYNDIRRAGHNFLKHADRDPTEVLTWGADATEALMMMAVLNAGELDDALAPCEIVFRDWYFAVHMGGAANPLQFLIEADRRFPGIREMSIRDQRAFGLRRVEELEASLDADDLAAQQATQRA